MMGPCVRWQASLEMFCRRNKIKKKKKRDKKGLVIYFFHHFSCFIGTKTRIMIFFLLFSVYLDTVLMCYSLSSSLRIQSCEFFLMRMKYIFQLSSHMAESYKGKLKEQHLRYYTSVLAYIYTHTPLMIFYFSFSLSTFSSTSSFEFIYLFIKFKVFHLHYLVKQF